ncbi:MAG: response regulator, partial [Enterobacterales bacterium]|nr:response regulator [Enterobacterales bacterium]
LKSEGFDVLTAENGKEGINLLTEQQPDLILTDLLMPEKDGVRVISEVRSNYPHIPIIAMSGGQSVFSPVFLEAASSLGATQTLTKPFADDELIDAIRSVLNTP